MATVDDGYLTPEACRTPADLERLGPLDLAELSRPATMLDLFRFKLEMAALMTRLGETMRPE